jgi:hypothetical protein
VVNVYGEYNRQETEKAKERMTASFLHEPIMIFPDLGCRYSDLLRARRSGHRISAGAIFFAPVQTDPGAHPASSTKGTGSFPEVKRAGRDVDHPPPCSAKVEGRVELYICSSSVPSWPVMG